MSIVLTEDHGAVRHLVLNRPEKRNAFNDELVLGLRDAVQAAADDAAVHCVVLRGAGPMFSSGMDVNFLGGLAAEPGRLRAFRRPIIETWNRLGAKPKPDNPPIPGPRTGGGGGGGARSPPAGAAAR